MRGRMTVLNGFVRSANGVTDVGRWGSGTSRGGTPRGVLGRRCTRSRRACERCSQISSATPTATTTSPKSLESFEAPEALPVRDRGVERLELDARVVEVVVDDLLPEGVARNAA
jgi:hypothetical protein